MTAAEKRALAAVDAGEVVRVYKSDRNILRGPRGVGAATLWRLEGNKLISDGGPCWGHLERTCRQVLTDAGRKALADQE